MSLAESYGQKLPDQVDRITALFDAHLGLITDVRDLYRDRVALEREYAAKLALITKKALEKKSKAAASLVVGDSPTKQVNENTIRQSTLDHAYSQIISSMSDTAQNHIKLADTLTTQVTEPLKVLERHNEDMKKKQTQFYQKLLAERDRLYQDRLKKKQKYDEGCAELEVYRQKQENAQQDRHADRATRQYEQHKADVLTGKNMYLVSIAVANGTKAKFYKEDLPSLEDGFQDLQTKLVKACAGILLQAQTIQNAHYDVLKDHLGSAATAIGGIRPEEDQNVFVNYNIRSFSIPKDWVFEPCVGHYDTDKMCVEPAAKVFLQNRLARSRNKLLELEPELAAKRDEVDKYAKAVSEDSAGRTPGNGNGDDTVNSYLDAKQQLTFLSTSEVVLRTEIDTIVAALGDDVGGRSPHTFKSSSFSIPTTCGYCKASIWGLSKMGKTCKACGLCVHTKCELKVPAECSGIRGEHSKASEMVDRRNSMTPSRSEMSTPSLHESGDISTPSLLGQASVGYGDSESQPSTPQQLVARVLFDFVASSSFELGVSEGDVVHIVEEDDGSGWVKVVDNQNAKGLVPASYLENIEDVEQVKGSSVSRAARSSQNLGSGQFVRVIYDYGAQGPDELSITEGETIELSSGPHGGQDYAEGWWEGYTTDGRKGVFPSNYARGFLFPKTSQLSVFFSCRWRWSEVLDVPALSETRMDVLVLKSMGQTTI